MAAVTHKIIIKRQDNDSTKNLILEDQTPDATGDDTGGGMGEIDPDEPVKVNSGEKIQWSGQDPIKNFCILFKDGSPFNGGFVALGAKPGDPTLTKVVKKLGGTAAVTRRELFQYAIVVAEFPDGVPTLTLFDPTIDVTDSGGGI